MRRLIAILVLTIGIAPSIPIFLAQAAVPSQEELVRHCRDRLGYSQTEPLVGASVFQLRRCITNVKKQYERVERLEQKLQRYDQHFWQRYEYGQKILRESRRGLEKRVENQVQVRTSYYKNTSLDERAEDLEAHRRSRRTIVREQEQKLLRERRAKQEKWRNAIQACRVYPRAERENCVQYMLTQ